jgi:hypothetical protein
MGWKKSRARLNLALACLVAFLIGVTYLHPSLKLDKQPAPLVADATGLQEIRIAVTGQPEIRLLREGSAWRMRAPRDFPVDAALMQGLLDSLDAPVDPVSAAGVDLAPYGLDKPLARLWLDGAEYDFGALQPVSKRRYLLHGNQVLLADDYLFYRVAHESGWWMDKHVLPEGSRITALQLPHATVTQDAKGVWQLAPADKSVTPAMLQRLATAWQDAFSMGVTPLSPGKRLGEVAVVLAGAKDPLRFEIRDDPDYLVLARPDLGIEYQLDSGEAAALLDPTAPAGEAK